MRYPIERHIYENTFFLSSLIILFGFAGCAPYAKQFDCGVGLGVGCKSLSSVNQMIEEGSLPSMKDESDKPIKRLWFAPFKDKKGYVHAPSYIYIREDS